MLKHDDAILSFTGDAERGAFATLDDSALVVTTLFAAAPLVYAKPRDICELFRVEPKPFTVLRFVGVGAIDGNDVETRVDCFRTYSRTPGERVGTPTLLLLLLLLLLRRRRRSAGGLHDDDRRSRSRASDAFTHGSIRERDASFAQTLTRLHVALNQHVNPNVG